MDEVFEPCRRCVRPLRWRASIKLVTDDGETFACVVESEHTSQGAARAWVERRLPDAVCPSWMRVAGRHDPMRVFGSVVRGRASAGPLLTTWECQSTAPVWRATCVDGVVRWRRCPGEAPR
ncbi:hypothetical protein M8542_48440 [Amycolatopsis sp. OK19-0408]|uniref:Uncharacterized protein n=1 Tax=Amycolatopsis iheyensis TaxID=2945988 RepID=A0A9X2NNY2_9PSEU|nr:hypothetical protein [Amycolatopsis iheyensis]MCR6490655.1 hypothetical protein [Amycolatopsis iheyensis]